MIDGKVREIVNEAAEFATHDPEPDPSELYTDILLLSRSRAASLAAATIRSRVSPMAIDILMPALSPTMEQGKLAKWLKKEGDKVKPGDVLAEIETDKATMEVEAIDEGVLAKILVADGTDNVAVNTPIAVLAGEGEDVSAARLARRLRRARRSRARPPRTCRRRA